MRQVLGNNYSRGVLATRLGSAGAAVGLTAGRRGLTRHIGTHLNARAFTALPLAWVAPTGFVVKARIVSVQEVTAVDLRLTSCAKRVKKCVVWVSRVQGRSSMFLTLQLPDVLREQTHVRSVYITR